VSKIYRNKKDREKFFKLALFYLATTA